MTPAVDLVLSTRGRTAELERLLESLAAQSFRDFRLILVDQNTPGVLDRALERAGSGLSILHLREERRGLSLGRNVGQARAEAEVVGFPDDDCRYPPGLLENVHARFENDPECDGLACRTVDHRGRPTGLRWDRRAGLVTRTTIFRRSVAHGTFLRRRVLEAVGPWDETLGVGAGTDWGSGEESDYYLRAIAAGFAIAYDPSLAVVHDSPTPAFGDEAEMAKAYAYGRGHSEVLRRHGYGRSFAAWRATQLLVGSPFLALGGSPGKARYYWTMGRGRLRGLR